MKVLHVLETSVPVLVGYTVRARYIVEHQRRHGLRPIVVTSPFFSGVDGRGMEVIDGITYYRSNHISRPDKSKGKIAAFWVRLRMLQRYREFVAEIARRDRPDVIHAHSSYTNGLAAAYASRITGVPFVYELRTLWGEAAVVEDSLRPRSLKYRTVWGLELRVMRQAKRLVTICQGIRDSIVEAGIDASKIDTVPNGVDTGVFAPKPVDGELAEALGLNGCFVVGFIGSLRRLEGLHLLIEAIKEVRNQVPNVRLLIVGDGSERVDLETLARDSGLGDVVRCTGLVPHDQIVRYYSVMDVLAYPRIDARINHTVTPLKPLEAMAMGKVCVASDVGGLRELVAYGDTGLLFARGDAGDLAAKLILLSKDRNWTEKLGRQALETVRRERDWSSIAARYPNIYRRAGVE